MIWLAPLWFAGLAALAVPIFIHLRRQRIGRRIRVGSLRHLSGTALPRRRRFQIRNPWLLALRAAILTALVLALAGPTVLRRAHPRRWALVSPDLMAIRAGGSDPVAPLVDSLRRAGAEIRLLMPGFPLADARGRGRTASSDPPDLWSLLGAADAELPAGSTILAVVRPRLAMLRGRRPALSSAVSIRTVSGQLGDTGSVEAAWRRGDSVFQLIARVRDGGTARLIVAERAGPAERIGPDDTLIAPADSLAVRIVADSTRRDDARFVGAAVGAAAATLGLPVALDTRVATDGDSLGRGSDDWTVRLGTAEPTSHTGGMLADARGTIRRTDDVTLTEPLSDAYGRPLLARPGGGTLETFAGRFSPRYGDFVLSAEFPQMIARLWATAALGVPPSLAGDLRAVAPAQLAPGRGAARRTAGRPYPLRNLLLALTALLLLAERWLAWRRR
jgi:hypothetical protein